MKVTSELLKKYYTDSCTESEKKAIEEWKNSPEIDIKLPLEDSMESIEDEVWQNISLKILEDNSIKKNLLQQKTTIKLKNLMVAASVVLLIGFGVTKLLQQSNTVNYQTSAGQIKTITLNDGTLVHLNANSTFKTPKEFAQDSRMVFLTGEAYFEVTKDSLRPFFVTTDKSQTKVLGTKFNLSAYPNEKVTLTLNEGKVLFSDSNQIQKLILTTNNQATIYKGLLKKTIVSPEKYNRWKDGKIYFNSIPFATVIRKIERHYGVKITVKKASLKNYLCKGSYNNTSLKTLLDDLSFVLLFKYTIERKSVTLY